MLIRARRALNKHLLKVTGTVHDDAVSLLHHILGHHPLQLVGMLGRVVKRKSRIEKTSSQNVMVDDHTTNSLPN